jgi:hypothetical protein
MNGMAGVYTNRKSHAISKTCVTFLKTHSLWAGFTASNRYLHPNSTLSR